MSTTTTTPPHPDFERNAGLGLGRKRAQQKRRFFPDWKPEKRGCELISLRLYTEYILVVKLLHGS